MKNVLINLFFIGLIAFGLISNGSAQTAKPMEPTAKEALKQILLNGDILLSKGQNCASVGTSKNDLTILDFLSGILSFQAAPQSSSQIEFSFKQEKAKNNEIVWVCDVNFNGKDAEDVWSNGIRFKMYNKGRKLLRNSIMCLGTG